MKKTLSIKNLKVLTKLSISKKTTTKLQNITTLLDNNQIKLDVAVVQEDPN